jgi:hypothetical protein
MAVRLPFFHDLPAHRYTVTLDGEQYEVRLVYRARTAAWYLDLADGDGEWLVRGRRLSPGSSPAAGVLGLPGKLGVFAADPYDRHEIELWYVTAEEIAVAEAAAAADDELLVVYE